MGDRDTKGLNRRSNEIYDAAIAKASNRHERVLWGDSVKQYYRFSEMLRHVDRCSASVLDIGCGNGELLLFLNAHGFTGEYTGVDINEGLLAEARKRYSGGDFRNLDIMSGAPLEIYDYVVMSGLFNVDFGQDERFIHQFVERMFGLCREKVVLNAISSFATTRHEGTYYVDPCDMAKYVAASISGKFEIHHGFVPYNFTFVIHKGRQWAPLQDAMP